MTETTQRLDIHILIKDLSLLDLIIKQRLDSLLNKCYNSIIITEILSYNYEQRYINVNGTNCDLSFRISFRCKYHRYYTGDIVCLMVCGEEEKTFNLCSGFCKGYMLKDLTNRILRPSEYVLATIFEPIYPQNDQFVCRLELYTPNPVIYKVTLTSQGSDLFNKLKDEINSLLAGAPSNELSDRISVNIGENPVSLDNIPQSFYLHLNNGNRLGLFKNIKSDRKIGELRLAGDSDYIFLMMIKNYLETIIAYEQKNPDYSSPLFQYYDKVIASNKII